MADELEKKGFFPGNSGNLSVRLTHKTILVTPRGLKKSGLSANNLVEVNFQSEVVYGRMPPSSELLMHLTIYKLRADAKVILHAHSPYATAFAASNKTLEVSLLPELGMAIGKIPLVPYGLSGTPELSEQISPFLADKNTRALFLSQHGVVCFHDSIAEAQYLLEQVEFFSKVSFLAHALRQHPGFALTVGETI